MSNIKESIHPENEKCIICNVDTQIPTDTYIDFRSYYVEGVGQLCLKCYRSLFKEGY